VRPQQQQQQHNQQQQQQHNQQQHYQQYAAVEQAEGWCNQGRRGGLQEVRMKKTDGIKKTELYSNSEILES
jgi:hypothetical protein